MKKLFTIFVAFFIGIYSVYASIDNLDINSDKVILYNLETNSIVYEKNSDEETAIASLTKLFTVYFAIENIDDLNEKIVLTSNMFDGLSGASIAGFKIGDIVSYEDLLYAAMLPSGADATNALSVNLFGSEEKFAYEMTKRMNELGLKNTSLKNSSGLNTDNHYSTAKDILNLLLIALENDDFKTIYQTKQYTTTNNLYLESTFYKYISRTGYNLDYVIGHKTGFTNQAGVCLASMAEANGTSFILITLNAPSVGSANTLHIEDAKTIYEYAFKNYGYDILYSTEEIIDEIPLIYAEDSNYFVKLSSDFKYLKNSENKYEIKYEGLEEINLLNVKSGERIGTVNILENDTIIYSEDVVFENIDFSFVAFFQVHIIPILIIVILLVVFLLFLVNKKDKKKIKSR